MKKSIFKTILMLLVTAYMLSFVVACNGNDEDKDKNDNGTIPSETEFNDVGISGGFDAEVSGTLEDSDVSAGGAVAMRWKGSNETSFNNLIAWLRDSGYDTFDGANATVSSTPDGVAKFYAAEKTVDGVLMTASISYFVQEMAIPGDRTYLAGEMVFGISPSVPVSPPDAEWPGEQIEEKIGIGLPAYFYTATSFELEITESGAIVIVRGADEESGDEYRDLLLRSGYDYEYPVYKQKIGNKYLTVTVFYNYSLNTIEIQVTMTAAVGQLDVWPNSQLAEALSETGISVPSYDDAESYDFSIGSDGVIMITAYEATDGVNVYKQKLLAAGFTGTETEYGKDTENDKRMNIDVQDRYVEFPGQVWIVIELASQPPVPATHYTLPENFKVQFDDGTSTTTVEKIGNEFYQSKSTAYSTTQLFLKYNDGIWSLYQNNYGNWTATNYTYDKYDVNDAIEYYFLGSMTFDYNVLQLTEGAASVIAGVTVTEYSETSHSETQTYYVDEATGLVFKYTDEGGASSNGWEVTLWDTDITEFENDVEAG